jgi:aromatic ring-cleaving dioxygenase
MDFRAAPRRGFAIHFSGQQRYPFAHSKQSQAGALLTRRHVKAYPVVPHHQVQGLRRPMQFDAYRLCPRMAHHVGQRLLSHPETGRLNSRIDPFQGWVGKKLDAKIGALRLLVEAPAQRRHQAQVIQKRRTKV